MVTVAQLDVECVGKEAVIMADKRVVTDSEDYVVNAGNGTVLTDSDKSAY